MKKLMMTAAMILAMISMESFRQQTSSAPKVKKIGVWKTYEDYANGNLTDLGGVNVENKNYWKDQGIFFDKEHVIPGDTKYWGAIEPIFELKPKGFVAHWLPTPNTSVKIRFGNGKRYQFLINPKPIGVYHSYGSNISLEYNSNGDITGCEHDTQIAYASKGGGKLVELTDKDAARFMFEDDPEILKQYDNDESELKGHLTKVLDKKVLVIILVSKYASLYNKKHGPDSTKGK